MRVSVRNSQRILFITATAINLSHPFKTPPSREKREHFFNFVRFALATFDTRVHWSIKDRGSCANVYQFFVPSRCSRAYWRAKEGEPGRQRRPTRKMLASLLRRASRHYVQMSVGHYARVIVVVFITIRRAFGNMRRIRETKGNGAQRERLGNKCLTCCIDAGDHWRRAVFRFSINCRGQWDSGIEEEEEALEKRRRKEIP